MRKLAFTAQGDDTVGGLLKSRQLSRRLVTRLKAREGGILLNGKHTRTIDRVICGDVVEIFLEDDKYLEENPALSVPIVYEDADLVIFNKPTNMPVHPSHLHRDDTLGNFFSYLYRGCSFRPINRLDRDTSGLCVVAKNALAAAALQRSIDKTYFAIVCGQISGEGRISAPIAREDGSIIKRCVSDNGQSAVTDYRVLESGARYSYLRIKLQTGRTHQIRVHFSNLGFPLAGDDLYGGGMEDITEQALHCGEVSFTHPITGIEMVFSVEIRADMKRLIGDILQL